MRKASESDIKKIMAENQVSGVPSEKMEICRIGCQLGYLLKDDVAYIINPSTTVSAASRRLTTRRVEYSY